MSPYVFLNDMAERYLPSISMDAPLGRIAICWCIHIRIWCGSTYVFWQTKYVGKRLCRFCLFTATDSGCKQHRDLSFFGYVRVKWCWCVGGSRVEIATPGGDCEFRVREFKCNIGT